MGDVLTQIGAWAGFAAWALLLVVASLLVYLGLGGNFVILGLALVYALATGFGTVSWTGLAVLAGIALLGELLEFVIGTFYPARKGASKQGVLYAFVGGLLGAAAGQGMVPIVGAILGSFAGAFAGAVLGEYRRRRSLEPSLRIGGHAFLGRLAAMGIKHLLGLVMVLLILRWTAP